MKVVPSHLVAELVFLCAFLLFSGFIYFSYNIEPVYRDYRVNFIAKADLHSPLMAGSSVIDITPKIVDTWKDVNGDGVYDRWTDQWYDNNGNGFFDAHWMAGFERSKPATSTLTSLQVRAVVLQKGDFSLGLVSIDTIGLFYSETIKTRLEEKEANDLTHLIIASTHTHAAPDTLGYWTPYEMGIDREHLKFIRKKINEALGKAKSSMIPSDIKISSISMMDQTTDVRIPPDRIVQEMTAIELVPKNREKDKSIIMAFGGCHPTLLGRKSNQLSSDWVGYFRNSLENTSDAKRECIFFNGAIGGQIIPLAKDSQVPFNNRIVAAKKMGSILADRLSVKLDSAVICAGETANLSARAQTIFIPIENKLLWLAIGIGYFGRGIFHPMNARTEIGIINIGSMKAITIPGELFPEQFAGGLLNPYGADFKSSSVEVPPLKTVINSKHPVVIGLANDEAGYIVPYSEWDMKKPHIDHRKSSYGQEKLCLGPHMAELLHKAVIDLNSRPD